MKKNPSPVSPLERYSHLTLRFFLKSSLILSICLLLEGVWQLLRGLDCAKSATDGGVAMRYLVDNASNYDGGSAKDALPSCLMEQLSAPSGGVLSSYYSFLGPINNNGKDGGIRGIKQWIHSVLTAMSVLPGIFRLSHLSPLILSLPFSMLDSLVHHLSLCRTSLESLCVLAAGYGGTGLAIKIISFYFSYYCASSGPAGASLQKAFEECMRSLVKYDPAFSSVFVTFGTQAVTTAVYLLLLHALPSILSLNSLPPRLMTYVVSVPFFGLPIRPEINQGVRPTEGRVSDAGTILGAVLAGIAQRKLFPVQER